MGTHDARDVAHLVVVVEDGRRDRERRIAGQRVRALRVGQRVPGGLAAARLGAREARPRRVRGARGGPCDDGRREQVEVAHAVPRVEPANVRAWRCLCVVVCVHGGGGL